MKPSQGHVDIRLVFGRPKVLLIAPHNHIAAPFKMALEKYGFAVTVAEFSSTQSRSPHTEQFALVVNLGQNDRHETGGADVGSHFIDAAFLSSNRAFPGSIQLFRKGAFTSANDAQRGLVEAAKDGTLFLDEISSLKLELQAKLLRLLEDGSYLPIGETIERRINAWMIAVSNENLADLVKKKLFRPDLYYRLKDIVINMPALRDRREDVLPLAEHFLKQFEQDFGMPPKEFSHEARDILQHFPWPGNVRELKRAIRGIAINCPEQQIMARHLPLEMQAPMRLHQEKEAKSISLDDWEKVHIVEALKQTDCNMSKAAAILRIDRKTLYRKIAKHHIDIGAFRRK